MKIKVALLGEGDVFLGMDEIAEEDFDEKIHVLASEFGGECDCKPGDYSWNRVEKRFQPKLNDWDRDFGTLVMAGLSLAVAHIEDAGALGNLSRQYYATVAKRFPHVMALHAKKKGN